MKEMEITATENQRVENRVKDEPPRGFDYIETVRNCLKMVFIEKDQPSTEAKPSDRDVSPAPRQNHSI